MSNLVKLDKIDIKILMCLQRQACITNQELADKVSLSPSACLSRVKKLEKTGIIRSYNASLNLSCLCRSITFIAMVKLQTHVQEDFRAFECFIQNIPEIIECYTVSGESDFFLKIICRDMQSYLALNEELIERGNCTVTIQTHVVMNENKKNTGYPLEKLL